MEVKVDIQKLQLLNDRIAQTIDALNQVRMSVYGITSQPMLPFGMTGSSGFGGAGLLHAGPGTSPYFTGVPGVSPYFGGGQNISPYLQGMQGVQGMQGRPDLAWFAQSNPMWYGGLSHTDFGRGGQGYPYGFLSQQGMGGFPSQQGLGGFPTQQGLGFW